MAEMLGRAVFGDIGVEEKQFAAALIRISLGDVQEDGHDDHHVAEPAAAGSRAAELITDTLPMTASATLPATSSSKRRRSNRNDAPNSSASKIRSQGISSAVARRLQAGMLCSLNLGLKTYNLSLVIP